VDAALKRTLERRVDDRVQKGVLTLACANLVLLGALAVALAATRR
jgi:hypothetical protein